MSDEIYRELVETSWRRALTPEEQARLEAWLAEHPEAQAEWESEVGLNQCLDRLPPAPLSSNFTARVMQAVEAEVRAPARSAWTHAWALWSRHSWMPRLAAGGLVLLIGLVGYHQYQQAREAELQQAMISLTRAAAALPSPEVLADFDAIQTLPGAAELVSDEELLAVLQR